MERDKKQETVCFLKKCKCPGEALHKSSSEKVFCKNAANLLEVTHVEV